MHRETRISNYILASFSIISLTLLSLPLSAPVQAFKACLTYILNPVAYYGAKSNERFANIPVHVRDLLAADIENRLMHEEIRQAAWVKAEAESLKVENRRFREALGLKAPKAHSAIWARVMERDPANWYRSLMVDSGADQGVAVNSPVLGQQGDSLVAIGRVVEVRATSSVVLLLTDELSYAAAYVVSPSTEEVKNFEGLLQGQGSARLRINYLSPDATVAKGDKIFTSPTSAIFPGDVFIGTVVKVYPLDPFLNFQSVEIAPAADASSLNEVMILKTHSAVPTFSQPEKDEPPADAQSGESP